MVKKSCEKLNSRGIHISDYQNFMAHKPNEEISIKIILAPLELLEVEQKQT
jgi:hypothetical protein